MEPQFPLPTKPLCQICGQPCKRQIVLPGNPNGQVGRPYFTCMDGPHSRQFSCWDDYQGIARENPRCHCNFTSRRFRWTADAKEFVSCPAGSCNFIQNAPMGLGYQVSPVVAATVNLTGTMPQELQGQLVATPPQGVPSQVVASNDHSATTSPQGVPSQMADSNDYSAATPPQGIPSQMAATNDHSAANPPRDAVEDMQYRDQSSDLGSSSPPPEKHQSEGKKKHCYCVCVVM